MTMQNVAVPGAPASPATPYDFRRPNTLGREHARVLELAFETFARQWATQLTAKVRVISQVTFESVQMKTYDEYASSLPDTTAMVLCELEGFAAKAVLQFPTTAALSWVNQMLGGTAMPVENERRFSPIEQALILRLTTDTLDDLRYSLGSLLVAAITLDGIHYNSQFAQAAATTDLMVVASFEIRVSESTATATLAMPADALLAQLVSDAPGRAVAQSRELLESQLAGVPLEVALSLTPAMITPLSVMALAVGDILPLPHPTHRPLSLTIDNQPVATAAIGNNGSRLACVVVTTEGGSR